LSQGGGNLVTESVTRLRTDVIITCDAVLHMQSIAQYAPSSEGQINSIRRVVCPTRCLNLSIESRQSIRSVNTYCLH
jgi:hypothetical protein